TERGDACAVPLFFGFIPIEMAFSSSNSKGKTIRVSDGELERAAEPRSVRRSGMDVEDRRNLQALEAISEDGHITQRTLATKLGIALGLTNIYLRRLRAKRCG